MLIPYNSSYQYQISIFLHNLVKINNAEFHKIEIFKTIKCNKPNFQT